MRCLSWLLGFFEAHEPQSMTRLVAFLCCLAGCGVALHSPSEWQTVTALIGGGAVALLTRNKPSGPDGPPSAPSSP